jgi:hypothetical protein
MVVLGILSALLGAGAIAWGILRGDLTGPFPASRFVFGFAAIVGGLLITVSAIAAGQLGVLP